MKKLALCALLLPAAVGCGTTAGNTSVKCQGLDSSQFGKPTADWKGTVFTIVMENHSLKDIQGNEDAPFINSLIKQNALAAGYRDTYVHPSEPNYLWMLAGENFGVLTDSSPGADHVDSTSHIVDELEMAGLSWHGYMESMGKPCNTDSNYPYEPKHDPFVFFDDISGWTGTGFSRPPRCTDNVVDYSQFETDLNSGNLARYVFITPNMIHDMHDGTVADGDKWLAQEVPKILASKAFNEGGVLFLTWDEGTMQSDDPPMIVISPNAKPGYVSHAQYDTNSYLKTVQKILGLQELPCSPVASTVQTMDELFSVPLASAAPAPTVASGASPAPSASPAPAAAAPAVPGA